MKVAFYGHARQYHHLKADLDAAISAVLESEQYVLGPALKRFEGEFAAYCGRRHAVGLNSGTDALWMPLLALGIGPGDEVITNPNTFFATAEGIWFTGATAVFVDCDPDTKCLDPDRLEAAIGPRTKAIMPVHLYGQCAPMDRIAAIARRHRLAIIEDNAQAIDAAGDTFRVGELSDAVGTSFIIQKNLGTFGDGGALLTDRDDIDTTVRRLRNHGSPARSQHSMGYNSRLDDLHAAILSVKLKHITAWSDQRRAIAAQYDAALAGCQGVLKLPVARPGYRHVYHLYVVETLNGKRDALLAHLNGAGIDAKCHYPIAIHQQAGYPWGKEARVVGSLANVEFNAANCVSLPMFPELTSDEVAYVIEQTVAWCRANG
jgi:dTDP-4-amino-4,6-dideoxygalactose transaminase